MREAYLMGTLIFASLGFFSAGVHALAVLRLRGERARLLWTTAALLLSALSSIVLWLVLSGRGQPFHMRVLGANQYLIILCFAWAWRGTLENRGWLLSLTGLAAG